MDNLLALRAFRRVVESSSFTRAAEALETTPGSVSKLVAQLEQHLGTRLLQRSTRRMSLTEAGRIYFTHCVRVLDELDPLLREAFLLKYLEELSYEEMSALTGVGVSALKMRVKRACDRLRERWESIKDE